MIFGHFTIAQNVTELLIYCLRMGYNSLYICNTDTS